LVRYSVGLDHDMNHTWELIKSALEEIKIL